MYYFPLNFRMWQRCLVIGHVLCLYTGALLQAADHKEAPVIVGVRPNLYDQRRPETLGLSAIAAEHQICYRAVQGEYQFCHHPNLAVWNNKLYLMWSNGKIHEDHNGQRVLYSFTENGDQWNDPKVLCEDPDGPGPLACVAAGWHPAAERMVAYYTALPERRPGIDPRNVLYYLTSEDGLKWSLPQRLAQGFYIEGPRSLPDGRLIMNGQWPYRQPRLRFSDNSDGISDWKDGVIPEVEGVYSFPEPSWFVRSDGSLVTIFRTRSGDFSIYASQSLDRGDTWSTPVKTEFPDATARAFSGNLPSGAAFVISNPSITPDNNHPNIGSRNPLTIALSADGTVFTHAWIIRSEPTRMRFQGVNKLDGWQYPAATVWGDALYIAYSINKEDIGVSKIKLTDLEIIEP